MDKIKKWIKDNHIYLTLGISAIGAAIFTYIGFDKGIQKSEKSKKEAEITSLRLSVDNIILKEKLDDEKKSLNEVSKDVDDMLDRK